MNILKITLICFGLLLTGCGNENVNIDTPNKRTGSTEHAAGALHFTSINSDVRGNVALEIYLPPNWSKTHSEGYPVIFFLHGGTGDETSFFNHVDYQQLNDWINHEQVVPFVLVAIESEYVNGEEGQWSSQNNEILLTSDEAGELRDFVRTNYNAGLTSKTISIHGQSRGARGALHYAFKFPTKFAAAMSNAFVSDYALEEEKNNILNNIDDVIDAGIKIRMVIGTEDDWVLEQNRQASYIMHDYLLELNVAHEFEILQDAGHQLNSIWGTPTENGMINGLYELKLHAQMWQK